MKEVQSYFQYYEHNLHKEILERKRDQVAPIREPELWIILYSLISSAKLMEENNSFIGDIRPQTVYFSPEGHILIFPSLMIPDENNIQKTQTIGKESFATYNQVQIHNGISNEPIDLNKVDSFAIGMTLLSAALLLNVYNDIYIQTSQGLVINTEKINQYIQQISLSYSKFFVNHIKVLLSKSDMEIPKPSVIHQILQVYENQIHQMVPFQPDMGQVMYQMNQPQLQGSMVQTPQFIPPQPGQYVPPGGVLANPPTFNFQQPLQPAQLNQADNVSQQKSLCDINPEMQKTFVPQQNNMQQQASNTNLMQQPIRQNFQNVHYQQPIGYGSQIQQPLGYGSQIQQQPMMFYPQMQGQNIKQEKE